VKFFADLALDTTTFIGLAIVVVGLALLLRLKAPRLLDGIYVAGGVLGALFLIAILVIIVMNMGARWFLIPFPGSTDYAGYCMAASSCFALAYALNKGAHIRVNLVLGRLGSWRRYGEIWCYGIAALMALVFARYAVKANIWSEKLNDISQGQDKTELWLPQLSMSIGAVLLAIALVDHLVRLLLTDHDGVEKTAMGEGEA
jgi:TRAP-type C4-dicarboxylate transport system permease small subunit